MGVYLSSPITEKHSSDGQNKHFTYGASSMQGWRLTQEDAHNCLADFDEETGAAMFAVYDGHGGSEVAEYSALHLPDYIKSLQSYKDNNLNAALKEAFLGFDATLVTSEVVNELKALANIDKGETCEKPNTQSTSFYHATPSSSEYTTSTTDEEAHDENEAEMLRADANIPIEELVAKYQKQGTPQQLSNKKKKILDSPAIRSKKISSDEDAVGETDVNCSNSSIAKITNGHADNENNLNTEKEFQAKHSVPDSSSSSVSSDGSESSKTEESGSTESEVTLPKSEQHPSATDAATTESATDSSPKPTSSSSSSSSISSLSPTSTLKNDPGAAKASCSSSDPGASNWEPQPGGSGCSPKKRSSQSSKEESASDSKTEDDDEEEEEEDEEEEEEEDSELDSDEEYEGDSSDDNGLEDDEEDAEDDDDDDEEDDYDNQNLMKESEEPGMDSGCTAVVALVQGNQLVVANAGDSRCVLCSKGKAIDLSIDHKPEDDVEKSRIEAAGGKVTSDGRVNGGLNLSRAIGDHSYKQSTELPAEQQMITALPDLQTWTLTKDDEFLVLACDGIWNFMSSQEVVDYVRERLEDPKRNPNLSSICEEIFDYCLAPNTMGDGTGCDNMTCVIVDLKKGSTSCNKKRTSEQLEDTPDTQNEMEVTPSDSTHSTQPSSKRSKKEEEDN
ncbi:probable protein phosphatase 2C 58 isoform X1 [Argonauta hians]